MKRAGAALVRTITSIITNLILVASLLVASLPGGEMTSYPVGYRDGECYSRVFILTECLTIAYNDTKEKLIV